MNLDRVTIQQLVFPPKDPLLSPLPLYRNMTIPSLLMSFRSAEYGARFQCTGGRGIFSLRLSHPHCSICSFRYVSVPSIAKAQRASWSYTEGCGDELFMQLPLFSKNCCLLQMPQHATPQDHLAHCGTLAREQQQPVRQ